MSPKPDAQLFPQGMATDWIKPGKSVWSWLAGNGGVTFENMKCFSQWAGQLGFQYNLVDEGWSRWNDGGKDPWQLMQELSGTPWYLAALNGEKAQSVTVDLSFLGAGSYQAATLADAFNKDRFHPKQQRQQAKQADAQADGWQRLPGPVY